MTGADSDHHLSPATAGLRSLGSVIPGLRSQCSLTRGYYLPPLRGSLTPSLQLEFFEDVSKAPTARNVIAWGNAPGYGNKKH